MSEQVGSVTRKKSSDFYGGMRFQSEFYNQMGTWGHNLSQNRQYLFRWQFKVADYGD